jgi:putative endonuclease
MTLSSSAQRLSPSAARRALRGRRAQRSGIDGEGRVAQALAASGWTIHGRRMRTAAGEIDIAAERDGVLALIEVKTRQDLDTAAYALGDRQRRRLCQAAAILQGENPGWGSAGMRFDAWLVDAMGRMRHVPDAFRDEG